eukprot:2439067-Amphidinium_carterae.1
MRPTTWTTRISQHSLIRSAHSSKPSEGFEEREHPLDSTIHRLPAPEHPQLYMECTNVTSTATTSSFMTTVRPTKCSRSLTLKHIDYSLGLNSNMVYNVQIPTPWWREQTTDYNKNGRPTNDSWHDDELSNNYLRQKTMPSMAQSCTADACMYSSAAAAAAAAAAALL